MNNKYKSYNNPNINNRMNNDEILKKKEENLKKNENLFSTIKDL